MPLESTASTPPVDLQLPRDRTALAGDAHRRVDPPPSNPQTSQLAREIAWLLLTEPAGQGLQGAANHLGGRLGADLLLVDHDPLTEQLTLVADSRGLEALRRLPAGHPVEQAVAEAKLLQDPSLGRDAIPPTSTPVLLQLASYCGVTRVRLLLITGRDSEIQGALLVLEQETKRDAPPANQLETLAGVTSIWAQFLKIRRESESTLVQRLHCRVLQLAQSSRARLAIGLTLVAIASMFVPVAHRVKARCHCEPVHRRVVVAPFEGRLLSSDVKPGDRVAMGQVLAVMDGSELRSQLAATTAELDQARQHHSSAVAADDASRANKGRLEIERLQAELKILKQREERLQLTSPMDGILISGDLEQAQGATLQVGQSLFEIAPLDQLVAEIAVPEAEVRHVAVGQEVALAFDGDFGNRHRAALTRIQPRAELREGENVFLAEASLADAAAHLAPGMSGYARIQVGKRPLGWILFHKPYVAWRRFWGWY